MVSAVIFVEARPGWIAPWRRSTCTNHWLACQTIHGPLMILSIFVVEIYCTPQNGSLKGSYLWSDLGWFGMSWRAKSGHNLTICPPLAPRTKYHKIIFIRHGSPLRVRHHHHPGRLCSGEGFCIATFIVSYCFIAAIAQCDQKITENPVVVRYGWKWQCQNLRYWSDMTLTWWDVSVMSVMSTTFCHPFESATSRRRKRRRRSWLEIKWNYNIYIYIIYINPWALRPDGDLDENTPSASLFRMVRLLRLTRPLACDLFRMWPREPF